jgi:hypothetical protein
MTRNFLYPRCVQKHYVVAVYLVPPVIFNLKSGSASGEWRSLSGKNMLTPKRSGGKQNAGQSSLKDLAR